MKHAKHTKRRPPAQLIGPEERTDGRRKSGGFFHAFLRHSCDSRVSWALLPHEFLAWFPRRGFRFSVMSCIFVAKNSGRVEKINFAFCPCPSASSVVYWFFP